MTKLLSNSSPQFAEFPPWDFQSVYPVAMPDAAKHRLVITSDGDEPSAEDIVAHHEALARKIIANLRDIQRLRGYQRQSLNPQTGAPLTIPPEQAEYSALIWRHWRQHRLLLDVHQTAFGGKARRAFDRHCVAAAEGVRIIELGSDALPIADSILKEQDRDRRRELEIDFFDQHCPVWIPGMRIWNGDQVGPYRVGRSVPIYPPEHPYYHHLAGAPTPPDQIAEGISTLTVSELKEQLGRQALRDCSGTLAKFRTAFSELLGQYVALYERGPVAVPVWAKTFQRWDKTPVTIWCEIICRSFMQTRRSALIVQSIESQCKPLGKATDVMGNQLELF